MLKATQLQMDFVELEQSKPASINKTDRNGRANKLDAQDRAFHDWYRFVLSYPPHLVRQYIEDFGLTRQSVILDPFCGTGTTLVEARLNHIQSIGLEANPVTHFASSVKLDWNVDPDLLLERANKIAGATLEHLKSQGIDDNLCFEQETEPLTLRTLDPEAAKLILNGLISPLPLHKSLILLDHINQFSADPGHGHHLIAFASALVNKISNLHFGPEVGVGKPKQDIPVVANWLAEVRKIANDLRLVYAKAYPDARVYLADARQLGHLLEPGSIDAVITSSPYPNEKDYTRITRLEAVLLGFIQTKADLRQLKKNLVRSNTRGVYKEDDDDRWVDKHPEIQRIAAAIEQRRIELEKDSGFERLYAKVTRLYFGGMARHFAALRAILRPGAQLAYVVGDQASYLQVMIHTGELLSDIAQALGYEIVRTDLFRTRLATATKAQLREEVIILRWPGGNSR
jgi:DNA modification methylase